MKKEPMYIITMVEYATGENTVWSPYAEEVDQDEYIYKGMDQRGLVKWAIAAFALSRWNNIQFEEVAAAGQHQTDCNAEWNNGPDQNYLTLDQKKDLIWREYDSRGLINVGNEDLDIMWCKEITEAQYAAYKELMRAPADTESMWMAHINNICGTQGE